VIRELIRRDPSLRYSVSVTTRRPRRGEMEGTDYRFVDSESFDRAVRNGEFLEWARVHGCYYGTPREPVQRWLTEKRTVLFDLDVQGAQRLKTLFPEAVSVFLLPPDTRTLRQRLAERKTESDGGLKARLLTAQAEIEMAERYDYVLVNDCLDDTVASLRAIVDHP